MAAFNKYNTFAVDLSAGVHDLTTAGSQLKVALTNRAPQVAADTQLSDINEISYANLDGTQLDIQNVGVENPAGTWQVSGTDVVWTASGAVATFQHVVLYNDTPACDPLIGWWTATTPITMGAGDTFTLDFGSIVLTVT